ncbi:hypothetical protein AMD26_012615 [Deinococcus sp. UR1]|nr:hypothetical protein AMD26_012615 [Deinococcus sp. UR1]
MVSTRVWLSIRSSFSDTTDGRSASRRNTSMAVRAPVTLYALQVSGPGGVNGSPSSVRRSPSVMGPTVQKSALITTGSVRPPVRADDRRAARTSCGVPVTTVRAGGVSGT